jgi:Peptidase inhibitor family I36
MNWRTGSLRASACGAGQRGRFAMTRAPGPCAGVVFVMMLSGCGSELVTLGPTPPDQGIIIYIHADFAGSSQAINVDVTDLTNTQGPCSRGEEGEKPTWRDCVSSIRVFPGWSATLYRDEDFRGRSVTITADTPNLKAIPGPCDGTFNDCVSSIRVVRQ